MSAIWNDRTNRLTGIETAILIKLADHGSAFANNIFPSIAFLAASTKFSERTVQRAIDSLVKKKVLKKQIRIKNKKQTSNKYLLNFKFFSIKHDNLKDSKQLKKSKKIKARVSESHPPGVSVTPPRVSESHPNHNSLTINEPTTDEVSLFLNKIRMSDDEQKRLREQYPEDYLKEKIEILNASKVVIEKPLAWFRGAVKHNYQPETKTPRNEQKAHLTTDDTKPILERMNSYKKSERQSAEFLELLGNILPNKYTKLNNNSASTNAYINGG